MVIFLAVVSMNHFKFYSRSKHYYITLEALFNLKKLLVIIMRAEFIPTRKTARMCCSGKIFQNSSYQIIVLIYI